jgi:hypothetical protein
MQLHTLEVMNQFYRLLVGVALLLLVTACPPFGPPGNNNGGVLPGPMQPFPPLTYGNPACGPLVNPGDKPDCSTFAAMKRCLKNLCERACPGPCKEVYYENGCPSSREDATKEPCVRGQDCFGNPIMGGFPIGQWLCDARNAQGESPYTEEKNRCGAVAQNPPANNAAARAMRNSVGPNETSEEGENEPEQIQSSHSSYATVEANESDTLVWDEALASYANPNDPEPGTCSVDPDTGACPEGTTYSGSSPNPVCIAAE